MIIPLLVLKSVLVAGFLDQAADQGDQEYGNPDNTGGKPPALAEIYKLDHRIIIAIVRKERIRPAVGDQADSEDHNQQPADKDRDGAGVSGRS